jgi:hypothetical protein
VLNAPKHALFCVSARTGTVIAVLFITGCERDPICKKIAKWEPKYALIFMDRFEFAEGEVESYGGRRTKRCSR